MSPILSFEYYAPQNLSLFFVVFGYDPQEAISTNQRYQNSHLRSAGGGAMK